MLNNNVDMFYYLFFIGLIFLIFFLLILKSKSEKIEKDIEEFIKENGYQKINPDIDELNELVFPNEKKGITLSNCFEITEDLWDVIWGDCTIRFPRPKHNDSYSEGSFFMFKFKNENLEIPYFYLRDHQGTFVESLIGSWFYNKMGVINKLLSDSYILEEPYIKNDKDPIINELKDFFTDDVVDCFLKMDSKHLPDERNMTFYDFSEFYSLAKIGVKFWGENDTLFVFTNRHITLKKRQELFLLAADIADAVAEHASKK